MPRLKDQAICIRLIDWSETSQIVAMLTREHGKLRGVAKGSKRFSPSSIARYSGGIELLTAGQIVGMIRPSSDLANLTEWDLQRPHHHLRRDLRAQRIGLYAADVVNAMLADHDPHPKVHDSLLALLGDLAQRDGCEASLLRFQWQLLTDCGYQPQLGAKPQAATHMFDPQAGGLTDAARTTNRRSGPWRVRDETVQLLRRIAAGAAAQADDEAVARANRLLCVYIRTLLDRELPTMTIVLDNHGSSSKTKENTR